MGNYGGGYDFDFGGAVTRGFLGGISAKRQIEETRTLMEDRAYREEAQKKTSEWQAGVAQIDANMAVVDAAGQEIAKKVRSGTATPEELNSIIQMKMDAVTNAMHARDTLTAQVVASSPANPHLVDSIKGLSDMRAEQDQRTLAYFKTMWDMGAEQKRLQLDTLKTNSGIAVDRAQIAESGARAGLAAAQTRGVNQETSQDAQLFPSELAKAESDAARAKNEADLTAEQVTGARNANSMFDIEKRTKELDRDAKEAELDLTRTQVAEMWREHKEKKDMEPVNRLEAVTKAYGFVTALKEAGQDISGYEKLANDLGFSIKDIETENAMMDEDERAKLHSLNNMKTSFMQKGDKERADLIQRDIDELNDQVTRRFDAAAKAKAAQRAHLEQYRESPYSTAFEDVSSFFLPFADWWYHQRGEKK